MSEHQRNLRKSKKEEKKKKTPYKIFTKYLSANIKTLVLHSLE